MRYSRQRELIESILNGNTTHPSAEDVYEKAKEIEPNISLGTVYRNLRILADEKRILTLETKDRSIHYDYNTARHGHFMCNECGRIFDTFEKDNVAESLERIGYSLNGANCMYYGLCPSCVKKSKKEKIKG